MTRGAQSARSLEEAMNVRDITVWRDGGTITFAIEDDALGGAYRLRTPFSGEPRPLFRDGEELQCGGPAERELVTALRAWLAGQITASIAAALVRLDQLPLWRNLPGELLVAAPIHRIRAVTRCLEDRAAS
jgi:hypothetical protein